MFSIDHLGVAVKSLEQAKRFYQALGLEIRHEETVAAEKVRLAMVPLGRAVSSCWNPRRTIRP